MMKIIFKPWPIGNELKTVSNASTHIVLHMELLEPKEDMADKEYVKEYGATTADCLRITAHWKGIVIEHCIGSYLMINSIDRNRSFSSTSLSHGSN